MQNLIARKDDGFRKRSTHPTKRAPSNKCTQVGVARLAMLFNGGPYIRTELIGSCSIPGQLSARNKAIFITVNHSGSGHGSPADIQKSCDGGPEEAFDRGQRNWRAPSRHRACRAEKSRPRHQPCQGARPAAGGPGRGRKRDHGHDRVDRSPDLRGGSHVGPGPRVPMQAPSRPRGGPEDFPVHM